MTTQQTAETKYIVANGVKLAYRRLGLNTGIPLVMMMHFRGNMDFWDPALINALAKSRPIILLDNAGIGKSGGEIPTTFQGWADHVINLVEALKIKQIDLLGFSMGGGASQFVVLKAPHSVRKLILAGTRTSKTPNTIHGPTDIFLPLANSVTQSEFEESWTRSFFNHDSYGRAAAKASWDRIFSRTHDRSPHLSPELAKRQIEGYTKFLKPHPDNPYERIKEQVITIPAQIARVRWDGENDLLIPTVNSFEVSQILPNAHLHIYPHSGHGFLFQHAELFATHVELFLDGGDVGGRDSTETTLRVKLA